MESGRRRYFLRKKHFSVIATVRKKCRASRTKATRKHDFFDIETKEQSHDILAKNPEDVQRNLQGRQAFGQAGIDRRHSADARLSSGTFREKPGFSPRMCDLCRIFIGIFVVK